MIKEKGALDEYAIVESNRISTVNNLFAVFQI